VLDALLRDTERAYDLQADGEYVRVTTEEGQPGVNSQKVLLDHYLQDEL
jgi:polyphosphate kinase